MSGHQQTGVENLTRYMPRISAEWSADAVDPWMEIDGTLVYIDISGFTNLSEKLARRGRIGAEELTGVLNYVFGEMLDVAYDRGGELLKFGGDALLLLFREGDHALHASSAAVEMQAVLRKASEYRTSAGRLHLKMSVGIHSGNVQLFRVGDSHKELILTGPAASKTTEMEETAVAGEILISSSTRDRLPPGSARDAKGDGWLLRWRKARIEPMGKPDPPQPDPDAVAAGVPVALRDYLRYGRAEQEHRIATIGFIKFQGVDTLLEKGGPPVVAEALDETITAIQRAADREGVTFLATDIDQDGGKVILVAGVPGAQEDDEGRVLRAARSILDRDRTLDLRIGVNRGHVFSGEIGMPFRATYTIMGDSVNLAARLMAAASPGELYAGPEALDRSLTMFETTALEPFFVKGKEEPVQAYGVGKVAGSRPQHRGGDLPFTGRRDELAELLSAIADLENGKGGVVTVEGETGIGKSRLVHEALAACDEAQHFRVRSEPYATATPYHPLREPIRELLRIERGDPQRMTGQLLDGLRELNEELLPMAPFFGSVAGVEVPDTPEADAVEPQFRLDKTAELVVELVTRCYDTPVLLDVEDGHWMDDASAHVLEKVASLTDEHPWLVLVTRQPRAAGFQPDGLNIGLGPLSDEDARKMIVGATAAAPLRPQDISEIVRRAHGIPLFLEEIIRAVRQSGDVDSLPGSLDAVVGAQIDALAPLPRRLLGYASVLGQSFPTEFLRLLVQDEDVELDAATRSQLEGFLDSDGDGMLQFRHALIRDVAYEGLSFGRRRELHLRAGEALEATAGDDTDSRANILALHFSLGGDYQRTWRYALVAGNRARDEYANVEAMEQYERAVEAGKRLDTVDDKALSLVWTSLGSVREAAGLYDEALDAYRRASRLVSSDPIALADLREKRARARDRSGKYRLALSELTSGYHMVESLDTKEAAKIRARLLASRATVRVAQQKYMRKAVKRALEAIDEAIESGEKAALARAYSTLDTAYRWMGEADKAVHGADALDIYEELGDLSGQGVVAGNLGAEAYFAGRWDEALDRYEQSRGAFTKAGNMVQAALAESAMGEVLVNQGKVREARPLLEDALRTLTASGFADGAAFAEVQLGRALVASGETESAREHLEHAHDQYLELDQTPFAVEAAVHLADCVLEANDPQKALEILERAEDMAGGEASVYAASMPRMKATVLAELDRAEEALEVVNAGLAEAERHGLPYEIALLLLIRADLARHVGIESDPDAFKKAFEILHGLGVELHPEAVPVGSTS